MTTERPPTCVCISLRKASRKLTAQYDEALAPSGINIAQLSLLRKVRRHEALSLSALGDLTELDRSTLGRNVRVLEKMGLVTLGAGKDSRESVVRLTEAGHATLAIADPIWDGVQKRVEDKLGAERVAQLYELLDAL